jgi:hypothetical protein
MKNNVLFSILGTTFLLIFLIFHFFLYIDIKNGCFIGIIPSLLPGNLSVKKMVKVIKLTSPDNYELLCSDVRIINKNVSCGGFDGGCYESRKPKSIYIGNDQNNLGLGAAILIHELCHREQLKHNRPFIEEECYKKGWEFMQNIVVY